MANRYPIIYIRGYAMTSGERDDAAADPFCGFNLGSTLYRAANSADRRPQKLVFESPVVRLMSEFQYKHVYQNGFDIMDGDWEPSRDDQGKPVLGIPPTSIIILRYYDDGSEVLGDGKARNIVEYARRLNELILKVKERVAEYQIDGKTVMPPEDFRCYLVAHSMGGLVARAFLQGKGPYQEARKTVDKLFTFATPHNGIDVLGINVPFWLTKEQANTFSREEMAKYLNLSSDIRKHFDKRVDLIPGSALAPERIFCMIGTNRGDYEPLQGAVRAFVGNGSDGLVRIDNASLWGIATDANGEFVKHSETQVATAYAYRSHSGYHGIVNSEEAYQNLVRFLFGDVRVDVYLDIEEVWLPQSIENELQKGKKVEAVYQFEFCAAPKGKRWLLTRRQSIEDSPAVRSHADLTGKNLARRTVYLSSVFLSKRAKVDTNPGLSYLMTIAVKAPDYVVDRRFWPNAHYEGADLFSDTVIAILTPPPQGQANGSWQIDLTWQYSKKSVKTELKFSKKQTNHDVSLPFEKSERPGIKGVLRLNIRPWE